MNDDRRKRITEAIEHLSLARETLEGVRDEEQEAFDNLTGGLQTTERALRMEEIANELDDAVSSLEDVESSLEECKA